MTLYFAGILSANLALVNILPFPPLDGGRMLMIVLKASSAAGSACSAERLTYLVGLRVPVRVPDLGHRASTSCAGRRDREARPRHDSMTSPTALRPIAPADRDRRRRRRAGRVARTRSSSSR